MHSIEYSELDLANREARIRHIEALKVLVRANAYQVDSDDIADGIIDDAALTEQPQRDR